MIFEVRVCIRDRRSSSTSANILLHPVQMILEGLSLMTSTNDEALQLLHLLLAVLLPDLEAIDLTPVMIKPPIDLLQISPPPQLLPLLKRSIPELAWRGQQAEPYQPVTRNKVDKVLCLFGQDKCPLAPGPSTYPSSGSPSNQPIRKMLEDKLLRRKQE